MNKNIPENLRDEIAAEYARIWRGSQKMIEYCCGKVNHAIKLDDGKILVFEKPEIETSFCFGYGAFDGTHAESVERENVARTREDYFIRENLKRYDSIIESLEKVGTPDADELARIRTQHTCSAGETIFAELVFCRWYNLERLTAEEKTHLRELTADETPRIIEAYKHERAAFEKRLRAYLKRYGLSKLNVWTYWADA